MVRREAPRFGERREPRRCWIAGRGMAGDPDPAGERGESCGAQTEPCRPTGEQEADRFGEEQEEAQRLAYGVLGRLVEDMWLSWLISATPNVERRRRPRLLGVAGQEGLE